MKMRTMLSSEKFSVFDFNDEDKLIEKTSRKMMKFNKNPRNLGFDDQSPVDKYKFLQWFAKKPMAQLKDSFVDCDSIDDTVKGCISGLDASALSSSSKYKSDVHSFLNSIDSKSLARAPKVGVTSTGSRRRDSNQPHYLSKMEALGLTSDDDDDIELSSSSNFPSYHAGNGGELEERVIATGVSGCEIDEDVVIFPDYVIYGDMNFSKSRLTFYCSCIKLEVLEFPSRSFEWTISEIVNVESQWCEQVNKAFMLLHLKSEDAKVATNAIKSGILEIKCAIFGPCWSKRQDAIWALNSRYKEMWSIVPDIDTAIWEDAFMGQNSKLSSNRLCDDLDEFVEEVIYPKGEPDAVTISKRDIQLLKPETFINDTVVDFYLKYLKNNVNPEEMHRFHIFNTFFFRKLADLDKDRARARQGKAAFERVRKWTRKVNLFEKDYIFIPVNFRLHWSLIVICHPGEVVNLKDDVMENLLKVPCILHMDSIKGSHRGLKNLFQSYLLEEWKERHNESAEDVSPRFLNIPFLSLEVPQQENFFDCGLFLLHYVELFIEQAPLCFCLSMISRSSKFLGKGWFPPVAASLKRAHIKKLIHEIAKDNYTKLSASTCDAKCNPEFVDENRGENGSHFIGKIYTSVDKCQCNYSNSSADQDFDITPLPAIPLQCLQCYRESETFFDDGDFQTARQIVLHSQLNNVMSPIEEVEEFEDETACSPSDRAGLQLVAVTSATPYYAKESSLTEPLLLTGISLPSEEDEKQIRSCGTSTSGSWTSSESRVSDDSSAEILDPNPEEDKGVSEYSSTTSSDELESLVVADSLEEVETYVGTLALSNQEVNSISNLPTNHMPSDELAAIVVEDSEDERTIHDANEFESSSQNGGTVASSSQDTEFVEIIHPRNCMPPVLGPKELHTKRRRDIPLEAGRRITRRKRIYID